MYPKLNFERTRLSPNGIQNYVHLKDPCPVFDGKLWHIYGTGCLSKGRGWEIYHAISESIEGPWEMTEPAKLHALSVHKYDDPNAQICAPGIVYDEVDGIFHMMIQSHCFALGGSILHLASKDGTHFFITDIPLTSVPDSDHAGIYDPHPALINGKKYIVYTAFPEVKFGELFLAESMNNTWYVHGKN